MPEVIDPPKPSFASQMAATRPKDKHELAAIEAGLVPPPKPTEPKSEPVPPKPPEAKSASAPAIADADDEILSGKRSPRGDDFKRVKNAATTAAKERDELKAKAGEFEKELTELRKAPKHNAELIKQLEKERDEFKTRYEHITLELKPEFHKEYADRVQGVIDGVKGLVSAENAGKLAQLIAMPESDWKRRALLEITEDLDQLAIADISAANREAQRILAEKQSKIATANQTLGMLAEERQKRQAERKAAYEKSFDAVFKAKSAGDDAIPILQKREGETAEIKAWNEGVEERAKIAKAVFLDQFESPEEKAEASIWAASAPGFLAELKAVQAENAQLRETLSKVQSASPGLGSGSAKPDAGGPKKSFTQRMSESAL